MKLIRIILIFEYKTNIQTSLVLPRDALPVVTSVIELIDEVVDVPWVVLTESKMLLAVTFFAAAGAGKTTKV